MGRVVDIGGDRGIFREIPEAGLAVDPAPIAARLKETFQAFEGAPLTGDLFAEMITVGVLMALEEMAQQGKDAGAGYILIQAPPGAGPRKPRFRGFVTEHLPEARTSGSRNHNVVADEDGDYEDVLS